MPKFRVETTIIETTIIEAETAEEAEELAVDREPDEVCVTEREAVEV